MRRGLVLAAALLLPALARAQAPLRLAMASPVGREEAELAKEELEHALSKLWGRRVQATVHPDYDKAAAAVATGAADVGWLQPLAYLRANGKTPLRALATVVRRGSPTCRSVVFVRADSKATELGALGGKRVAWTQLNSSTGFRVPAAMLRARGVKPAEEPMLQDHSRVCRAVWEGLVEAGATFSTDGRTPDGCRNELDEGVAKLRVLAVSPPTPNDLVVLRPGFDDATAARYKQALLKLDGRSADTQILLSAFAAERFQEVKESDFEPLRPLVR